MITIMLFLCLYEYMTYTFYCLTHCFVLCYVSDDAITKETEGIRPGQDQQCF